MTVSVILRLLASNLAQGRVVGRAEIVDTGETISFKDQQEMLDFILRSASDLESGTRGALSALHGQASATPAESA
jgi:hypothetical protein